MTLFRVGPFAHLKGEKIDGDFTETPAEVRLAEGGRRRRTERKSFPILFFVLGLSYVGKEEAPPLWESRVEVSSREPARGSKGRG